MSLVEISNLTVAFNGTQVLHGIDLTIEKGEAVGLVGVGGGLGVGVHGSLLLRVGCWFDPLGVTLPVTA